MSFLSLLALSMLGIPTAIWRPASFQILGCSPGVSFCLRLSLNVRQCVSPLQTLFCFSAGAGDGIQDLSWLDRLASRLQPHALHYKRVIVTTGNWEADEVIHTFHSGTNTQHAQITIKHQVETIHEHYPRFTCGLHVRVHTHTCSYYVA